MMNNNEYSWFSFIILGGYAVDEHGIHHITMPGVIERSPESQAYATVTVSMDMMDIRGVGEAPSIKIPLKW